MNEIQSLQTCPSYLNTSHFNTPYPDCFIVPTIGSGHALVQIVCKILGENQILGFYPEPVSNQDPFQFQAQLKEQKMPQDRYPKWFRAIRQAIEGWGGALSFYGGSSGLSSMPFSSSYKGKPSGKYLGKNLARAGFRVWSYNVLVHIPVKIYDYFYMGQYVEAGKVVSDDFAFAVCAVGYDNCKYTALPSTPNQILKALQYVDKVKKDGKDVSKRRQFDDVSKQAGVYKSMTHNCIDFTLKVTEAAGHENWINELKENNEVGLYSRITSVAWHYLYYRNWRNS